MSIAKQGEKNPRFGATVTEETRKRIGQARKGKNPWTGKKRTPEFCNKVRITLKGKKKSPEHVANSVAGKKKARELKNLEKHMQINGTSPKIQKIVFVACDPSFSTEQILKEIKKAKI